MTRPFKDGCTDEELSVVIDLERRIHALDAERKRLSTRRILIRQRAIARLRTAAKTGRQIRIVSDLNGNAPEEAAIDHE